MNLTTSLVAGFLIATSTNATASNSCISKNQTIQLSNDYELIDSKKKNLDQEYKKLFQKLYSYKELAQNWDGYNGIQPSEEIVETTESFLNILKNNQIVNPKIMISGDGTIGLFWKNNHNYLEVDFDTAKHLSFFYEFGKKVYGEDDLLVMDVVPEKLLYAINTLQGKSNTISQYNGLISSTKTVKSSTKSFINVA
jgi:hypothetical protein